MGASPEGDRAGRQSRSQSPLSPTDGATIPCAERHEARFAELLALEENWNSYRARRVKPATVDAARPFVNWLEAMGCTPWVCPLSDGGLNIERAGVDDYTVEVCPSGALTLHFDELTAEQAGTILQHAFNMGALKRTDAIAMETRRADTPKEGEG